VSDAVEIAERMAARGSKTPSSGSRVKHPKSKHKQRQLEQRARWIVREWTRSPTYSYDEMCEAARERFAIGIEASRVAYARANEIIQDATLNLDADKLLAMGLDALEQVAAEGDWLTWTKLWNAITQNFGYAAPRKAEVTVGGAITVQQMAHLSVISLTPAQREQRYRELEAKARAAVGGAPTLAPAAGDVTGLSVVSAAPALRDIVEAAVIDVVSDDALPADETDATDEDG
jgi:hypothetical protein